MNEGRVAVVTGANQGLGFALVEGLCRVLRPEDAVYLTARDERRGAEAMATLRARGLTPQFARLDVSDPSSVETAGDSSSLQAPWVGSSTCPRRSGRGSIRPAPCRRSTR